MGTCLRTRIFFSDMPCINKNDFVAFDSRAICHLTHVCDWLMLLCHWSAVYSHVIYTSSRSLIFNNISVDASKASGPSRSERCCIIIGLC